MQATWIWARQDDYHAYHQTIVARRTFEAGEISAATLRITADTRYRLRLNGEWVNDGPCRAWPEHYQYDVLDVAGYLRAGVNTIEILAIYYGCGSFHQVPRHAGLLAELTWRDADGVEHRLGTDESWEAAPCPEFVSNTPKISIQQGPLEVYDSRLAAGEPRWSAAVRLHEAQSGPWQDLHPRDVALLTREPVAPARFVAARTVKQHPAPLLSINLHRLLHPGLIEANGGTAIPCVLATVVHSDRRRKVTFTPEAFRLRVNGQPSEDDQPLTITLRKGDNLLLAAPRWIFYHDRTQSIAVDQAGLTCRSIGGDSTSPWSVITFPGKSDYAEPDLNDGIPGLSRHEPKVAFIEACAKLIDAVLEHGSGLEAFTAAHGGDCVPVPAEHLLVDPHQAFVHRQALGDAHVESPAAMLHDTAAWTTVPETPGADTELVIDFGDQRCGYWEFEVDAAPGTVLDLFAVEFITPDGTIQHCGRTRNCLRFIARGGIERYLSTRRRSGRYLFINLRRQTAPVRIRFVRVVESTYPVDRQGSFACSDARLSRIWEIAARTLVLCMEDTFVDCPLYEQTLWIGDARNEALFAYTAFGATDIARRCIRLGGQSLERYPIVGCQVPSAWDVLLPAWSFLWGISVWDYYAYSGDRDFLREAWPWVVKNLEGTEALTADNDLFTGPFWNMFDWSGADQAHACVTHNSMLAVGAVDAAIACGKALGESNTVAWLETFRKRLVRGINRLWDDARGAYPDSIHADGAVSASTCQHTSTLALLYDIIPKRHRAKAREHLLDPPEEMVKVGSPFAIQYVYEAMEKIGCPDAVIASIYQNYLPMLESGATTVWEVFPSSRARPDSFPTRSHTHAWSSAPIHFLNRIVLGIQPRGIGSTDFVISPRPNGLTWARGATATPHGPIGVRWAIHDGVFELTVEAPPNVTWRFESNDALADYRHSVVE